MQDAQARGNLRNALSRIKKTLPKAARASLRFDGASVSLDPSAVDVDVARFERLVADSSPDALGHAWCPKRCTATNQERPAAKAVWTSGTATLRQQLSRPVRCSRRRNRVIGMPLGRVGQPSRFRSCATNLFSGRSKPRSGLRLLNRR